MTRFRAEIAALDEHWQGRTIAVMLRHAKADDIGARAPEMQILVSSRRTSPKVLERTAIERLTPMTEQVAVAVPQLVAGCQRINAVRHSDDEFQAYTMVLWDAATSAVWKAT